MASPDPIREQSFERALPNSSEAERAILGAVLLDNGLISQAIEQLRPEDFYVPSHRRIFVAMIGLFERGSEINPILIGEELKKENALESVGGISFISNLTYGLPHSTNITHYAKVVRGKSMLRQLIKAANKITQEALQEEDEPELILDHAEHAAIQAGAVVGMFSLEMSKEALVMRMLCSQGNIDAQRFRNGFLSRLEWAQIAKSLGTLADAKIFLDDTPGLTVLEMRAKSRRLAAEQKRIDLIVVDYLQLMSGSAKRFESRQQEVSQISRELKGLAKELNVPLVALSQLSRAPESRSDHRPQLADLRESGALEQDADLVAFLYREDVYKTPEERQAMPEEKKNVAELILAKQRNGPTATIELRFVPSSMRFDNLYRGE